MIGAQLAQAMAALGADAIPDGVAAQAKRVLLDTIGCIIAARDTEMAPIVAASAGALGAEMATAYSYGRLGDCMDFNEGYAGAHFGCGAVAAVLALGAHRPLPGAQALAAVVAGFETGARITDAIGSYYVPDAAGRPRFAPVWGIATQVVFAAVAASCRALGMDAQATAQAYELAGSNSPVPIGSAWSASVDLPNTKYCDAGWCTVAGLFAALSAQAGSTGVAGLLDGPDGLYRMLGAPNADPAAAASGLGTQWRLPQARFKTWPCCGLISAPMAALQGCIADSGIAVPRIEAMVAEVSSSIVLPRFTTADPQTFVSRQFSLPHGAAMLLLGIPPGGAWLSVQVAGHEVVRALRAKLVVRPYHGPEDPTAVPRPCAVQVLASGREYRAGPGTAAPPPSPRFGDSEVLAKFRSLVEPEHGEAVIAAVMTLETLPDLEPLTRAVAAARPQRRVDAALARLDAVAAGRDMPQ